MAKRALQLLDKNLPKLRMLPSKSVTGGIAFSLTNRILHVGSICITSFTHTSREADVPASPRI